MSEDNIWDAEQVRHAIWLALPPTATGNASLGAAASAVGVSVRSVQRWLAGTATPSPAHAIALRTVLLPPADILARQREERDWASEANTIIGAPRGRGVAPSWRSRGWHKPHVLRTLVNEEWGVNRVSVGLVSPAKPYYPPRGWTQKSATTYPHRPAALLAKHEQLDRVAPWRAAIRSDLVDTGRHECWLSAQTGTDEG